MSTLEKTIDLLYALPEREKPVVKESLDDIFSNIVGVLPDTGKTLEEYRAERIHEKYEAAD